MEYRFESFTLNTEQRELHCGGELRHVEPQVFDLLHFLIVNRERVVSRADIFQAVWRGRIVSDIVLSTRINAARVAIGDDGTQQRLIRTVRGGGFRFVGAVSSDHLKAGGKTQPAADGTQSSRRRSAWPSIAVLPFTSAFRHRHHDDMVAELSERIRSMLCRLRWLNVVAHAASACGSPDRHIRQIADELNARYLLSGNVRYSAGRLRIATELVEGASGYQIWTECYERDVAAGELAGVCRDLAIPITTAVETRLCSAEMARTLRSGEFDAWHRIIGALPLLNTRRKVDWDAARNLLIDALRVDPGCAQAYSLLSYATTLGIAAGWKRRVEAVDEATELARKAWLLDADDSWAHLARGFALAWDRRPEDAIATYQQALGCNPQLAYAHTLIGAALCYLGRSNEALEQLAKAQRFSSGDLFTRGNMGVNNNTMAIAHFIAGRYEEGIAAGQKALVESPKLPTIHRILVANQALAGKIDTATEGLRKLQHLVHGTSLQTIREWLPFVALEHRQAVIDAYRLVGLK